MSYLIGKNITTQVFAVILVTLAISLILRIIISKAKPHAERTQPVWDNAFAYSVEAPLQTLIWIIGIGTAISFIPVDSETNELSKLIGPLRDIGVIVSIAWFLIRFTKLAHQQYIGSNLVSGQIDRAAADAIEKIVRLAVFITAVLVTMQTLGLSIAGVLTFGGVGGLAIGFAAKDLLANFFGGMMIYLDRPFAVGDWVRSADREIEGTVEDIGWRITVIRKFDSRPIYIPNSVFSTVVVENASRMTHRQLTEKLSVRHEDAPVLDTIISETQLYLENHPDIDSTKTVRVSFETLSATSLDILIYCFTRTRDLGEFSIIKQQILLHVLGIINANGAQSSTLLAALNLKGNRTSASSGEPS